MKEPGKLSQLFEDLQKLEDYQKWNKLKFVFPETGPYRRELYNASMNIMAAGKDHRFRCFAGGNRTGKSFWLATEIAYHVTGEYPEWWDGRILKKPRAAWIICESGKLWRDSLQKLLFGESGEEIGTGLLPLAEKNNGVGITNYSALEGTSGGIGSCIIKHKKGHTVQIVIKTNEMEREQFQAAKVDVIGFDEEPKPFIYTECLMRLMGTGEKEPGIAMLAFTPLKGLSEVVLKFLPNGVFPKDGVIESGSQRYVCAVDWDHTPHLTKEDKEELLKDIPLNERDSRTKGIPGLGSGRIYPVEEEFVVCEPFRVPEDWKRAYGLDFGWVATAVVWIAENPSTKVRYIYGEYKRGHVIDDIHIQAIKDRGIYIKGAYDPSEGGRKDDGTLRSGYFKSKGLSLVAGVNNIDAGIARLYGQFETGSLKIMSTCPEIIKEFRLYRYDSRNPGVPARNQEDHLLDALKYVDSKFEQIADKIPGEDELEGIEQFTDASIGRSSITGY